MSENADESDQAFQELVRLLEKAVQAGADAVGLQWEEQDLMMVHYFGSMGRTGPPFHTTRNRPLLREEVQEVLLFAVNDPVSSYYSCIQSPMGRKILQVATAWQVLLRLTVVVYGTP